MSVFHLVLAISYNLTKQIFYAIGMAGPGIEHGSPYLEADVLPLDYHSSEVLSRLRNPWIMQFVYIHTKPRDWSVLIRCALAGRGGDKG